ncbi:hypothetical protein [Moorella sp. ACPs]|uniref:hypothetical protein n=1 Tax=Neomoorella carbonis TaxID=3062783 RepID=UPI0038730912
MAKEHLRSIRVPGYLLLGFEEEQDDVDEEEFKKFIRQISAELAADHNFIFNAVYCMPYSLHHERFV